MGSERIIAADKRMTQSLEPKRKPKQAELPLGRQTKSFSSQSKILFQLKSELNRLNQRDQEWKLLFSMLGHDLKEPLVTLEGFTKLLEEASSEPKDRTRYLKIIREAINSLHALVESIQSVSRLYYDPSELSIVSLKEILDSVTASLSEQISRSGAKISYELDGIQLLGDPVRLYQIFINLIGNSIKYHKIGSSPQIQIRARPSGDFYRILISDNGVGMSSEDLKRAFRPFIRPKNSSDGMGLGLSIVKRIAESMGGKILIKSQPACGTTFSIFIPRKPLQKGSRRQ